MKSKICEKEECTNPVWSNGFCKNHTIHKPLKTQRKLMFHTDKNGSQKMAKKMERMLFFQEIWNEKLHKSEISGTFLGKEILSIFFHHILPKNKYPEAELDKENIILLTPEEHESVENDIFIYQIINERRKILLEKYNLI